MFETIVEVSFGDCDPAGIVFYPNYYRWFDGAFQSLLAEHRVTQKTLRAELGIMGTGLIDSGAKFLAPLSYGQRLELEVRIEAWSEKTLRLRYLGQVDSRPCVEGFEVRGLFVADEAGVRAGPIAPLRELLEGSRDSDKG